MSETRNLMIAVTVSVLILAAWQYFYALPQQREMERYRQAMQAYQQTQTTAQPAAPSVAGGSSIEAPLDRTEAVIKAPRVSINTEHLAGSINLQGGRLDDLTLKGYRETVVPDSKEVALLSPSGTPFAYFVDFGWAQAGGQMVTLPNNKTTWKADNNALGADGVVTLTWDNGAGLVFTRQYQLDKDYMFTVTETVQNTTTQPVDLSYYALLSRILEDTAESFYISHEGPIAAYDERLQEYSYKDARGNKVMHKDNTTGWIGFSDKYWLAAIIPSGAFNASFKFQDAPLPGDLRNERTRGRYQADTVTPVASIQPGESKTITTRVFAGAKKADLLDYYMETLNIPLLDRAIDFGMLYFLTKPMAELLKYFYGLLGNFGLAIMLLTVVVKLVMFPLANKSYTAMNRMKLLQPEVEKIKERSKGDKLKLQQEVIALYKKEKVNPMSGCLPILIQLPVFFALYKVLFISIDMRHAPFYGWIQDLSAADPTNMFNLFGLIPWEPPAVLAIGAWAIIMGVSMILQQSLQPKPTDPTQAMVIKLMPYVFVWAFASMPSGLLIYWSWNNFLSALQQWLLGRTERRQKRAEKKNAKLAKAKG